MTTERVARDCAMAAGADASACVYSLVKTAKANGLGPYTYLNALLTIVPGCDYQATLERMEQRMPGMIL